MWRILWALPVVAAVILVLAWLRPPAGRARFLRLSGLALTVMFLFGGAVWIAGEAFIDPGGLRAMALIAWWLVPLTVLSAIAWYRPALATGLLGALTAGVVGVSLWYAIDPGGGRCSRTTTALSEPSAHSSWRRPSACSAGEGRCRRVCCFSPWARSHWRSRPQGV